ncbi:hypothetical protein [Paracoccus aminovorans]
MAVLRPRPRLPPVTREMVVMQASGWCCQPYASHRHAAVARSAGKIA